MVKQVRLKGRITVYKKNTLQFFTGQITNNSNIEIQKDFLLADSKSAELKILASYWLAQEFDRFSPADF
jgi:hypothetical protein